MNQLYIIKIMEEKQVNRRQKNKIKKMNQKKIHEILDLVMDRNENGDYTFFEYSGHINAVSVFGYDGQWNSGSKKKFDMLHYNDRDFGSTLEEMREVLSDGRNRRCM